MRASDYDKIVDLQAPTKVADGIGGFTETYATKVSGIWAAIWPISAKDRMQADQMTGELTHRIRIRYRRVLKPSWRIKYGNRYFAIIGPPINLKEKNRDIEMLCKEIQA